MRNSLVKLIVCASFVTNAYAQDSDPQGLWKIVDENSGKATAVIKVVKSEGILHGTIQKVLGRPDGAPAPTCDACEGELKGTPIIGLRILSGHRDDGEKYSGGEILDPGNGKTYSSNLKVVENGMKMEVRGYVGLPLFGRSQIWERVEN